MNNNVNDNSEVGHRVSKNLAFLTLGFTALLAFYGVDSTKAEQLKILNC